MTGNEFTPEAVRVTLKSAGFSDRGRLGFTVAGPGEAQEIRVRIRQGHVRGSWQETTDLLGRYEAALANEGYRAYIDEIQVVVVVTPGERVTDPRAPAVRKVLKDQYGPAITPTDEMVEAVLAALDSEDTR